MRRFPLAPMSPLFFVMTGFLMLIPLGLALPALRGGGPIEWGLVAVAVFIAAIYASVWFWWRPTRVELSPTGLTIVFPMRRKETPWTAIEGASHVARFADLKERFGTLVRVGAGGLWGGFGWLKSTRGASVEFYISRMDTLTLVERPGQDPLLLSTRDASALEAAIRERARAPAASV